MSILPFDQREGVIWYNGVMVPWRDCKLHVLSHGLHYGSCVFEGERAYNGRVFKHREHKERLQKSAEILGFKIPYSVDELIDATHQVLKAQNITNGYVRPVAWRGSEMMAISAQQTKIHVAIAAWEWPSYFSMEAKMKGIRLDVAEWRRPPPECAPTSSKAAGLYMICTLSKHKAESKGFDDTLMLDWRGHVAEATGANIFLIKDGKIHTPTPDCFLDGITRRTVIDLAQKRGIEVITRTILPDELSSFEQAFLTGTAAEITPIGEIKGITFTVGEMIKTLIEDYTSLVNQA